jgi:hypothetical protein
MLRPGVPDPIGSPGSDGSGANPAESRYGSTLNSIHAACLNADICRVRNGIQYVNNAFGYPHNEHDKETSDLHV